VSPFPEKILAIQFKYLGDAVFLTPALRALREYQPAGEVHVLVAAEIAPLFEHIPWLTKVWLLPRTRGKARLRDSWPVIRALRREGFDRSVDFGGNDRGAILSFFSGARLRLGCVDRVGLIQKLCYTQRVSARSLPPPYVAGNLQLLAAWQVPPPASLALEIAADPAQSAAAARLLPAGRVVCHLGTSQPRKEWPLKRWQEFYHLARTAGFSLAFSSGPGQREQALLTAFKQMEPDIFALPSVPALPCSSAPKPWSRVTPAPCILRPAWGFPWPDYLARMIRSCAPPQIIRRGKSLKALITLRSTAVLFPAALPTPGVASPTSRLNACWPGYWTSPHPAESARGWLPSFLWSLAVKRSAAVRRRFSLSHLQITAPLDS